MSETSKQSYTPFSNAPGWKGDDTICCIWRCGHLAEFTDSQDMGSRPNVIVYYCQPHAPVNARRWRTLDSNQDKRQENK